VPPYESWPSAGERYLKACSRSEVVFQLRPIVLEVRRPSWFRVPLAARDTVPFETPWLRPGSDRLLVDGVDALDRVEPREVVHAQIPARVLEVDRELVFERLATGLGDTKRAARLSPADPIAVEEARP